MTTPETTANRSLHSREHANIPPERRDHRATPVSTAGSGVDTHEMVLMHRVLRREVGQLPRLFRSAANDPARSKIIGAHAREMLDFLHTHHTGEDLLLFPLLRERRALDPELMDRMDAQHAQVNDAVVAINAELPTWTTSADAAAGERMAACIDTMMPSLIGHCDEEEQKLLPVVSVTLSQSEWDALGKHGISAIPVTRRLVTLGYITEETDDAERQKFMQVLPAPVRLAYKLIGHRQFTHETTAIRGLTHLATRHHSPSDSLGLWCRSPSTLPVHQGPPQPPTHPQRANRQGDSDDIVASGRDVPQPRRHPNRRGRPDVPPLHPPRRTSPCSCSR